jgi:hypothetical protein
MSDEFSDKQIQMATWAFLGMMRREYIRRYPDQEVRIPTLEMLTVADRQSLFRAIKISLAIALRTKDT